MESSYCQPVNSSDSNPHGIVTGSQVLGTCRATWAHTTLVIIYVLDVQGNANRSLLGITALLSCRTENMGPTFILCDTASNVRELAIGLYRELKTDQEKSTLPKARKKADASKRDVPSTLIRRALHLCVELTALVRDSTVNGDNISIRNNSPRRCDEKRGLRSRQMFFTRRGKWNEKAL